MKNYKALKAASKASVAKKEVDGREELQLIVKAYDPSTGEEKDDKVRSYKLTSVANEIKSFKSEITKMQAEQADWEQLEKDLKAL